MLPDPSIVMAMQHAMAPPAIVRAVQDVAYVGGNFDRFLAQQERRLTELETYLDRYVAAGVRQREGMWASFRDNPLTPGHMEALDRFIEGLEEQAERETREFKRSAKRLRLAERQIGAQMPAARAAVASITRRLVSAFGREHAERVDFGFFLRALRAEHDPRARGGPIFDDPLALRAHLRAALN